MFLVLEFVSNIPVVHEETLLICTYFTPQTSTLTKTLNGENLLLIVYIMETETVYDSV